MLVELDLDNGVFVLNIGQPIDLDAGAAQPSPWTAMAAGDIDGDGKDELIVARKVSDGKSPTVLALKWDAASATFNVIAFSMIGNDGNSAWVSMTAGDFNADGRLAVALAKNQHPNFVLLDLPKSSSGPVVRDPNLPPSVPELRTLATSDLDSVDGQLWTGIAAADWLGGNQGDAELLAVRSLTNPYRTNVFVYGNPFHRVSSSIEARTDTCTIFNGGIELSHHKPNESLN